jgi:hypothetical protein
MDMFKLITNNHMFYATLQNTSVSTSDHGNPEGRKLVFYKSDRGTFMLADITATSADE